MVLSAAEEDAFQFAINQITPLPSTGENDPADFRVNILDTPDTFDFTASATAGNVTAEISRTGTGLIEVVFHFDPGNAFDHLDDGEVGMTVLELVWILPDGSTVPAATLPVQIIGVTDVIPPPPPPPPPGPDDPPGVITFNDPTALEALPDHGRLENQDNYTEEGFTFRSGVIPPDPALGGEGLGYYKLVYDPDDMVSDFVQIAVLRGDLNVEDRPRSLSSFSGSDVIQMTYDPTGDGELDTFGLESIRVLEGALNLGVKRADDSIAVYHLPSPGNWTLPDATNLKRATLEAIGPSFTVDDIVLAQQDTLIA